MSPDITMSSQQKCFSPLGLFQQWKDFQENILSKVYEPVSNVYNWIMLTLCSLINPIHLRPWKVKTLLAKSFRSFTRTFILNILLFIEFIYLLTVKMTDQWIFSSFKSRIHCENSHKIDLCQFKIWNILGIFWNKKRSSLPPFFHFCRQFAV